MAKKVYRAAVYARLSKEDGDREESNSITSQRAICESYIAQHGDLELVGTFIDDGYSGVSLERPDFRRMEQEIKEGGINCVVVKDLSRFARNYIEAGKYQERIFPKLGVRFIAVNDGYDSLYGDPQSDSFIIPFKNLFNDTYCKDISIKIRSSLDVKRKNGEYVGNFAPYGYKKAEGNRNALVVDEGAAGTVRLVFSLYKDGMSIQKIADRLNGTGTASPMEYKISQGVKFETMFKTGACAKWSYNAVKRILTNEIYIGILAQGKTGTPNYKVRQARKKDEDEWVRVEDAVEPLVTYEDFMAVRMMLGRDMRSAAGGPENNVLSGFLFCADCGQTMVRKTVPSKNRKYVYYVCSSSKAKHGCTTHCISAAEAEKAVLNAVRDQIGLVLDLDAALERIGRLPDAGGTFSYDAQIAKLEEEIECDMGMKLGLYESLSAGVIDREEYTEFRNRYSGRINGKRAALERLKKEQKEASAMGTSDRRWVALFKEHENIEKLDRRVLMGLVDKVLVHEGHGVELLFKYGTEYARASRYAAGFADALQKAV